MKTLVSIIVAVAVTHLAVATEKIRVTTLNDPPYVSLHKDASGNVTKFEGFVFDLLKYITDELNTTYEVTSVTEQYGAKPSAAGGKWTGLIGELEANHADIAAAALTKNKDREAAVGLTHGFLKMKLQLLLPKDLADTVKQIKDLAHVPDDIKFGAVEHGNTWQLLKSTPTIDQNLTSVVRNLTGVKSVQEGVKLVRQGKFVAILEGHTANYYAAQPPCELATTEGEQHEVEYVFAVNKDKVDLKNKLNAKLDEEGTKKKIEELKKTYWPHKNCENSAARPIVAFSVLVSSLAALLLFAL